MRAIYFLSIFSLLSSTLPVQAEQDYDLYDTKGRRIGEMRSRGSRTTVIDELTVDPNAPTVGEGLDSIASALEGRRTRRREERAEKQTAFLTSWQIAGTLPQNARVVAYERLIRQGADDPDIRPILAGLLPEGRVSDEDVAEAARAVAGGSSPLE